MCLALFMNLSDRIGCTLSYVDVLLVFCKQKYCLLLHTYLSEPLFYKYRHTVYYVLFVNYGIFAYHSVALRIYYVDSR